MRPERPPTAMMPNPLGVHNLFDIWQVHLTRPVLLLSKSNEMFLQYFDPEKLFMEWKEKSHGDLIDIPAIK